MSASNATPFAVYGQAFRLHFKILSSSTGNPITGGLTGLTAQHLSDASSSTSEFVACSNAPVEVLQSNGTTPSGYGYLDLTAAEMSCSGCVVRISATNSNAVEFSKEIVPMNLSQFTGRYDAQSVVRFEQILLDVFALAGGNGANQTGAALQFLNPDGSQHFAASVTQSSTTGSRSKTA